MHEDKFMQRAIAISRLALTTHGAEPFGAVVVKDGQSIGEGLNHSKAHHDPTSHGEVEAIRDACRRLECVDLSGCDLYTSCEPCAMCVATMTITGVSNLYYAADAEQAGKAFAGLTPAKRHPIDVDAVRVASDSLITRRKPPAEQHRASEAVAILKQWAAQ
jgi:tRNA(Arg) A34 adenosine deaminase TadA